MDTTSDLVSLRSSAVTATGGLQTPLPTSSAENISPSISGGIIIN